MEKKIDLSLFKKTDIFVNENFKFDTMECSFSDPDCRDPDDPDKDCACFG